MADPNYELMFEILKRLQEDNALNTRTSNFVIDELRFNLEQCVIIRRTLIDVVDRLDRQQALLERQEQRLDRIERRLGLQHEDA